jgi:hypothetical protein
MVKRREKQEGQNVFTKEQTESHEKRISNFTAEWPENCVGRNNRRGLEEWEVLCDDLACTIGISEDVMAGNENAIDDTNSIYGTDGRNNLGSLFGADDENGVEDTGMTHGPGGHGNDLWSLLGADDERRPERDPFDLGLNLESPDIQRWADEEGWTEVLESAARHDSGWSREMDEEIQAKNTERRRPEKIVMRQKAKARPRSIRNVKRGFDLDFHDLEVQTKWPWSLHWSLEDASFAKKLFAGTIKGIGRWIDWQGRRGIRTDLADREEADVCEDEWYVFSIAVTWFRIACRNYIPVAIKDIITVAIETRQMEPVRLNNEEMEKCIAKWRGLPVSYHHDQLNLAELGCSLQENMWRSCLQLGGLLTLQEANAIQALILASAEQAGQTLNQQDWESAYILNWRDN